MPDAPTSDQIRARAHALWQQAGEPEGRSAEFWHQAETELAGKQNPDGELPPGMTENIPI